MHTYRRSGNVGSYPREIIPYSRKNWRGIKFGGLADQPANRQIKIRQYLSHSHTLHAQRHVNRSNHYYCIPIFQARFHIISRWWLDFKYSWEIKPLYAVACSIGGSSTRVASVASHSPSMSTMLSQARMCRQIMGMARSNSAIRRSRCMVEANPPNLIPVKFSSYTVCIKPRITWIIV
jgi:hypothetical protein